MEFCWRKTVRWSESRREEERRARESDTELGRECARGWRRGPWGEAKEKHPKSDWDRKRFWCNCQIGLDNYDWSFTKRIVSIKAVKRDEVD